MAFKYVVFAAFIAVARAGGIGYAAPVAYSAGPAISYSSISAPVATYAAHSPVAYTAAAPVATYAAHAPVAYAAPVAKAVIAEPSAPAHYDYGYSVSDPHTGDSKSQHESRRGDVVQGSYSLIDSDGTRRTVDYAADAHNGFNAVVRKEALAAPVVAKVAAPVAYATPAVSYAAHAAPVVAKYAAGPVAYSAPAVSYAAPAVSYTAHAAPVVARYAAAPVAYSSPAVSYAAPTYSYAAHAGPVVAKYAAAPAYYH